MKYTSLTFDVDKKQMLQINSSIILGQKSLYTNFCNNFLMGLPDPSFFSTARLTDDCELVFLLHRSDP